MKLYEFIDNGTIASGASSHGFSKEHHEIAKLDLGYEQLEKLAKALNAGNFGYLIDKPYGRLTEDDIRKIKTELFSILHYNVLLIGENMDSHADGEEKLRVLGHLLAHGFEATALTILTGLFGGMAISGVISGAASWLSILFGGLAIGSSALLNIQLKDIYGLLAAGKLLNITDAYENISNPEEVHRSWIREFLDFIEGKTQREIQREIETKIKQASADMQRKFSQMIRDLPPYIVYYDDSGQEQQYPTAKLFEF